MRGSTGRNHLTPVDTRDERFVGSTGVRVKAKTPGNLGVFSRLFAYSKAVNQPNSCTDFPSEGRKDFVEGTTILDHSLVETSQVDAEKDMLSAIELVSSIG